MSSSRNNTSFVKSETYSHIVKAENIFVHLIQRGVQ